MYCFFDNSNSFTKWYLVSADFCIIQQGSWVTADLTASDIVDFWQRQQQCIQCVVLSSVVSTTRRLIKNNLPWNSRDVSWYDVADKAESLWLSMPSTLAIKTTGSDRIINALAAATYQKKYSQIQHFLLIDAGTAVTIDYVKVADDSASSSCSYQGGWILPGRYIYQHSLSQHTSQIKQQATANITVSTTVIAVGKNTQQAVTEGCYYGWHHSVMGVLQEIPNITQCAIFCTGGDGDNLTQFIQQRTAWSITFDAAMAIKGLQQFITLQNN